MAISRFAAAYTAHWRASKTAAATASETAVASVPARPMTASRATSTTLARIPASTRRWSPARASTATNSPARAANDPMAMGVIVPAWMSAGLNASVMRWPCSSSLRRVVPSGVIASESQMNTAGTTTSSAHSTRLRRQSRQPMRIAAASWSRADPGWLRQRGGCATRLVLTITAQPRAAAARVQVSAQPRSPSRPPWWDGRSTIHNDRKWVGSNQRAGDRADRQVDDGEHQRAGNETLGLVDARAELQRQQRGCAGQQRDGEAGHQAGADQPGGGQAGDDQPAVGGTRGSDLEVHRDGRHEPGGPPGGDRLHLDTAAGAAEQLGGVGQRTGGHDHEHQRDQHQDQKVDRVAHVVGEEPAHEQAGRGDRGHRGTALPSRRSMMRSKRSSSTTKWLMISTLRPARRRSATRVQNFW